MSADVSIQKRTTSISDERFDPLEIEHLAYQYMKGKRAVSLVYPGNAWIGRARIINMSPRTALNLLAWLEQEKDTLEQLAKGAEK